MEPTLKIDYPAAHSMDTYWFAMDEAGEVALMITGETGPVPEGPKAEYGGLDSLDEQLEKDEYGIPILPLQYAPFPDGGTTAELEAVLADLPAGQRELIQKLALHTDLSAEEKKQLRSSITCGCWNSVALLADAADAADVKALAFSCVVRLDPFRPPLLH